MSYNAKVYKVFIASPSDVISERNVIRNVLARWNDLNSESKKIVLLPVGWDTHAAPEVGKPAQQYIDEYILDKCDILIGVFWSCIGSPTKNYRSGTIEEISRHIQERKLAMLYFSKKPLPPNVNLKQVDEVRKLKEKYKKESLYCEFADEADLEKKLYDHLALKMEEGKFRPVFDSDILASIKDDNELAVQIQNHYPLVSKNLLKIIMDEERDDIVWDAIVKKLVKSPADLRDSLIHLAKAGAFKHLVYKNGYIELAKCSQPDFGNFLNALYSINKFEFLDIYNQGLLEDSPFSRQLIEQIRKNK